MKTADGQAILIGDWRRRTGTKTEAHLWPSHKSPDYQRPTPDQLPKCGKRIPRWRTTAAKVGRPCYSCLVAAITRRYID